MPRSWSELPPALFLCAAAGFGEELLFRGHLIPWILAIGGDSLFVAVLAVGIPGTLFALAHRYQENRAVIQIALMAWIFGAYFMLTGSIVLLIVLHFAVDAIGCVLGILVNPDKPDATAPDADSPTHSPAHSSGGENGAGAT